MEQTKRGGKRKGSGRKPSPNPKIIITLYVEKKSIWQFGTVEKLKEKLIEFIANSGKQEVYDAPKLINPKDEPPKWIEPKKIALKSFQDFMNGMADLEYEEEYKKYGAEIMAANHLSDKQRNLLLINLKSSKL